MIRISCPHPSHRCPYSAVPSVPSASHLDDLDSHPCPVLPVRQVHVAEASPADQLEQLEGLGLALLGLQEGVKRGYKVWTVDVYGVTQGLMVCPSEGGKWIGEVKLWLRKVKVGGI